MSKAVAPPHPRAMRPPGADALQRGHPRLGQTGLPVHGWSPRRPVGESRIAFNRVRFRASHHTRRRPLTGQVEDVLRDVHAYHPRTIAAPSMVAERRPGHAEHGKESRPETSGDSARRRRCTVPQERRRPLELSRRGSGTLVRADLHVARLGAVAGDADHGDDDRAESETSRPAACSARACSGGSHPWPTRASVSAPEPTAAMDPDGLVTGGDPACRCAEAGEAA